MTLVADRVLEREDACRKQVCFGVMIQRGLEGRGETGERHIMGWGRVLPREEKDLTKGWVCGSAVGAFPHYVAYVKPRKDNRYRDYYQPCRLLPLRRA